MAQVCQERELFEVVEFYWEDSLEMAIYQYTRVQTLHIRSSFL